MSSLGKCGTSSKMGKRKYIKYHLILEKKTLSYKSIYFCTCTMLIQNHIVNIDFSKKICDKWFRQKSAFYWDNNWQLFFNRDEEWTYPAYIATELIWILQDMHIWVVIMNGNLEKNNNLYYKVQYDMFWIEIAELVWDNLAYILSNILIRALEIKKTHE